jgi:hypothetical protein
MKKVYKYGTGQEVPEDAIYLKTIVEEAMVDGYGRILNPRFVWHYFLVEVDR